MTTRGAGWVAAVAVLAGVSAGRADEGAVATGRAVAEKHRDAIVEVALVLKIKAVMSGREGNAQEHKIETHGVVIDPSGLTVISNVATDPMAMFGGEEAEESGFKMDAMVTDVKIVLADGKEYPSKLVLRDKDLDLAFVRPDEAGLKLPALDLKEGPEPKLLDEMVSLSRMDRSANREPVVTLGRIVSVIRKPRVRYVLGDYVDPGSPVFDASGQILGLALMRPGGSGMSRRMSMSSMMPAVLPCADILDVVKQVPPPGKEAPAAPEKKEEEKVEPKKDK